MVAERSSLLWTDLTPPQFFSEGTWLASLGLLGILFLVYFFVTLLMARLTKPNHLERFVVILVVSQGLFATTTLAWLWGESSQSDGPCNGVVSCSTTFVRLPPGPVDLEARLDALGPFRSFPVVLPNLFKVFLPMLRHVIFGALLALVKVAVAHPVVFVKLIQRLDGLALKAFLRTNHATSPVR
jgi:hypothetical protein